MKKYLFIALAALGLAACAEKMDDNSTPNGELEEAYIAINLMSADANTRAAEDKYGYEEGTEAERPIHKAYFFFFDDQGKPFNVTAGGEQKPGANSPGGNGDKNHLSLQISGGAESDNENISDIKNAVLILNTYKGVYPSKIVAVLNWTPQDNVSYTLEDLHEVLDNSLGNDKDGYVMSNSVYVDGTGNIVDAVPLTAANIKTTPEAAIAAPIDIYVERTAAKVVLTAEGKIEGTDNIFDTQKNSTPLGLPSEIDVYVKLYGWELYNDYNNSSILKNIEEKWDPTALGLTWNDAPYYRCYWAVSQITDPDDQFSWNYEQDANANGVTTYKGFPTEYGFAIAPANNLYATRSTYTYCGENTNGEDMRTKVILKGQLMQKDAGSEGGYKKLELARWYGTEYAGITALKIAVANSLKHTLYYKEGDKYFSIESGHIDCIEGFDIDESKFKEYEVGFQLSNDGQGKEWYQYSSQNGYVRFGDTSMDNNDAMTNEYLKSVEPALLYADGNTYYIVDIKHLGTEGKPAEYGVVRNHVYQIDIRSIKGYGTPVYIGTSNIETPEYPVEDESSYVAARINVLSWKVVKQGVDVK